MRRVYFKLIAITLVLLMSVSVVVMSSYAWLVLTANPVATGIQVTIGGGNTILIAPDITQVVDGVTYHYPGGFTDKMNFSQYRSYSYLSELGGLTPVSTADGVHWFLPDYYESTDLEVADGEALPGALKPVSEFILDGDMAHANLLSSQTELIKEGSYIYLDFWVVSPGANYTLRISTGDDTGGSFLVDLLQPAEADNASGYTLAHPNNQGAAAVRIGFLTNPNHITDDTMLHYSNSIYYKSQYTRLQGILQEPNSGTAPLDNNRFMIYEPNGDAHPNGGAAEGTYVITSPVGMVNGTPAAVSVGDRVTVQKTKRWAIADTGIGTAIEQRFQAAIFGKDLSDMSRADIAKLFYVDYLQWQIAPYLDGQTGSFIKKTEDIYKYSGYLTAEQFAALDSAGATEDIYIIQLERNVPQRIRMFIWLEGQDVDCVNSANSSSFTVNIEFAGSNDE